MKKIYLIMFWFRKFRNS